jgi:hypothetical protein
MKRITDDMVKWAEDNGIYLIDGENKAQLLSNSLSDAEVFMLRSAYLKSKLMKLGLTK